MRNVLSLVNRRPKRVHPSYSPLEKSRSSNALEKQMLRIHESRKNDFTTLLSCPLPLPICHPCFFFVDRKGLCQKENETIVHLDTSRMEENVRVFLERTTRIVIPAPQYFPFPSGLSSFNVSFLGPFSHDPRRLCDPVCRLPFLNRPPSGSPS